MALSTTVLPLQPIPQQQGFINPQQLIQGTGAYFDYRKRYLLTASTVPNVFGYGYESPRTFFKRLVQHSAAINNSYVDDMREEGIYMEAVAADLFAELSGLTLQTTGLWPHPEIEWLAASPDRMLSNSNTIMEIKTRTEGRAPFKPGDEQFIKFWLQMQVQMQCCGADYCIYYGYSAYADVEHEIHIIERDDKQWVDIILPELIKFKEAVDSGDEMAYFGSGKRKLRKKFEVKTVPYNDWLKISYIR